MPALLRDHWPHLVFVAIGVIAFLWTAYRPERSSERVPVTSPMQPKQLGPSPTGQPGVRRSVAKRGLHALGPLLGAMATGAIIYGVNLTGGAVPGALIWAHSGICTLALLLVVYKLTELGLARIWRAVVRQRLHELVSIALGALSVPLLVSGAALVLTPSTRSLIAYSHLISSVWWTGLMLWHLRRHLRASVKAVANSGRRLCLDAGGGSHPTAAQNTLSWLQVPAALDYHVHRASRSMTSAPGSHR
jgi:hypothetical protein